MSYSVQIFEALKAALIARYPKDTPVTVSGEGFADYNIINTIGTLPTTSCFDFVTFETPVETGKPITTDATSMRKTTETWNVNLYCKQPGTGLSQKQATLARIIEVKDYITNWFNCPFSIDSGIDQDYNNNGTMRVSMDFTMSFA